MTDESIKDQVSRRWKEMGFKREVINSQLVLYEFQDPKKLHLQIQFAKPKDLKLFVCSGKFKSEREASIVSLFAIGYSLMKKSDCEVRLSKNEPVDAEFKVDNKVFGFQITECLEPGRRRGDEYKTGDAYSIDRPIQGPAMYVVIQETIIRKKSL